MLCSWPVYCASPSSPEGRFQQVAPGKQQSVILQSQVSLEIPSSSNHSVTLIVSHIKGWRTTVPVCRKKDIFALSGMSYKLSCTNFSFPLTAFSVYRDTLWLPSLPILILGDRCPILHLLNVLVICKPPKLFFLLSSSDLNTPPEGNKVKCGNRKNITKTLY